MARPVARVTAAPAPEVSAQEPATRGHDSSSQRLVLRLRILLGPPRHVRSLPRQGPQVVHERLQVGADVGDAGQGRLPGERFEEGGAVIGSLSLHPTKRRTAQTTPAAAATCALTPKKSIT
jgi:hypothetical protein